MANAACKIRGGSKKVVPEPSRIDCDYKCIVGIDYVFLDIVAPSPFAGLFHHSMVRHNLP
jgi:hypothetical protein